LFCASQAVQDFEIKVIDGVGWFQAILKGLSGRKNQLGLFNKWGNLS